MQTISPSPARARISNGAKPAPEAGGCPAGTPIREYMKRMAPLSCPQPNEEIPALNAVICTVLVLNSVLERNGNRIIEEQGLTMPQWLALGAVAHSGDEGLPHSQLGERLMLSKAPITGIVDRLVRSGLATRQADARDRRVSRIMATPEGVTKWWSVKEALRARTEEICGDCLSHEEKETLLTLLGRLLEKFAAQAPQPHDWVPTESDS